VSTGQAFVTSTCASATIHRRTTRLRRSGALLASLSCLILGGAFTSETKAQEVLPRPDPKFKGVIGLTYKDSTPDKIPLVKAPAGAPNVLFIMIDDAGFGDWSTFGGQIPTPNLDRLAQMGLRYTRFHTTALCSPTRAALLTGRNHHSAGTGVITEIGSGYPGYSGQIPKSEAMFAEVLRQNGYSTAFFGKNHNIPDWETSVSGPFDRWPTMQGFDHFYGFIGGEANQWQPALYDGNKPVEMEVPKGREKDYTLTENLTDKAIEYIHQEKSVTPDRPFFIYYAPGATHAPHHVPKVWIDKFKGQFDQGWDKYREETYQRQLKMGIIPADTKLTPRPKEIPAWDSLSPDEKKVGARLMEAFAGMTAQTDYEAGRLIDAIGDIGQLDNTLIMFEVGDNGASMEGTLNGVFNEMVSLNGQKEDTSYIIQHLDEIGGPEAYNHFPVGWAWAMNTPFQWGKQVASHFGGTRNPLVIAWPNRIKDKGGIRTQFHDVIDISPTVLEAAGVPEPVEVNGVWQKPIEGVSMMYSFDDPKAKGTRGTQYFEMFGNRALYHDGWIAVCRHGRLPWQTSGSFSFDDDKWELYNIDQDFSESNDLSAQNPAKLHELQDMFWGEAAKYNVLPIDDRFAERADPSLRPSLIADRTDFTYFAGAYRIPESSSANIKNKSHVITAYIDKPGEGVLVAAGGTVGGYTLFVKDGRPTYEYNWFAQARYRVTSSEKLPAGKSIVRVEFKYDGGGLAKGGTVRLFINDKKVGEGRVEKTIYVRFSADETFDTGLDTGSPVSNLYQSPFRFTGTLNKIEIDIAPTNLKAEERQQIEKANNDVAAAVE
jgi:arylsulfatase A-like enzyme